MIDPFSATIAAVGAASGVGKLAVGVVPLIKEENAIRRLERLEFLLEKVEDRSITSEELIEIKNLSSKLRSRARARDPASTLAYLEEGKLLLKVQNCRDAEEQIDLIMFDEDCDERPQTEKETAPSSTRAASIYSSASLKEVAQLTYFDEQRLSFDTSSFMTEHKAPPESVLHSCSSGPSTAATSITEAKDTEDPIIEAIANAKRPKSHATLKKAACWSLLLTTGPVALLAPQVRRNLLNLKTKF
jgi:hypothetical protein